MKRLRYVNAIIIPLQSIHIILITIYEPMYDIVVTKTNTMEICYVQQIVNKNKILNNIDHSQ